MNKRTKHNLDAFSLTSSQIEMLIKERIHSRRDREILKLRLVDGLTFEEISEVVSLSPAQTKIVTYKRIDEISRYCLSSI